MIITRESLIEELENCILPTIYIPELKEGISDRELHSFLFNYHLAAEATIKYVAGDLDEETMLDVVEFAGMNMDDYIAAGQDNLDFKFGSYA